MGDGVPDHVEKELRDHASRGARDFDQSWGT